MIQTKSLGQCSGQKSLTKDDVQQGEEEGQEGEGREGVVAAAAPQEPGPGKRSKFYCALEDQLEVGRHTSDLKYWVQIFERKLESVKKLKASDFVAHPSEASLKIWIEITT